MKVDKIIFYSLDVVYKYPVTSVGAVWEKDDVKAFLFFTESGVYVVEEKGEFLQLYLTLKPELDEIFERLKAGKDRSVEFLGYRIEFLGALPKVHENPFGAFVVYSEGKKMVGVLFKDGIGVYGELLAGLSRQELIKVVNEVLRKKLEEIRHEI